MNSRRPILGRKGPGHFTFIPAQTLPLRPMGGIWVLAGGRNGVSLPGMTVLGFRSNIVSGLGRP